MNFSIDVSSYHLRNMGDLAMLQVAVSRIRDYAPSAEIRIFTSAPERLRSLVPDTIPMSPRGRNKCFRYGIFPKSGVGSFGYQSSFSFLEDRLRMKLLTSLVRLMRNELPDWTRFQSVRSFLKAISESDVVVATGGGFLTESSMNHGIMVLSTLELAYKTGKPTTLFGQGIGPIISKHFGEKL